MNKEKNMKPNTFKHIALTLLLLCTAGVMQAQKIAVKTDALMLGTMTPNVGGELIVGERTSICLSAFGNYKPYGKDIKMIGVIPEWRYWFNGRPLIREYVGIAALGTHYDITWKDDIYHGDALGAGLSFGYVWKLGRRIAVECYASCSAVYFKHKHYNVYDNMEDYELFESSRTDVSGWKIMPTKIGVSFTYILK